MPPKRTLAEKRLQFNLRQAGYKKQRRADPAYRLVENANKRQRYNLRQNVEINRRYVDTSSESDGMSQVNILKHYNKNVFMNTK